MSQSTKSWKETSYSEEANQALSSLKAGQGVMAVRMKAVKGNKVQVEFAEKLDNGNATINVVGLLNASDERFTNSGPSRTWISAERVDLKKVFGFELPEGETDAEILKMLPELNGNVFGLQIIEVAESNLPKSRQGEYLEQNLKRAGNNGEYFYLPNSNERVGRYINLVAMPKGTPVQHTLISNATIGKQSTMSVAEAAGQIETRI